MVNLRNLRLIVIFARFSPKLAGLFIVCAVVAYCEIFSFSVSCWQWPKLSSANEADDLRVLFVADPQLVGLRNEPPFLGAITRWDCDKYLQFGFFHAVSYVRPDVVVFLGDLLDEGSVASDDEYLTYVHRFRKVFRMPTNVQSIFTFGDNDVGGEGLDSKQQSKIDRFTKHLEHYKAGNHNVGISTIKHVTFQKISDMRAHSTGRYRIVCNHMPLLGHLPMEVSKIIEILQPHLIVTAHTHLFRLYRWKEYGSQESLQNRNKTQSIWKKQSVDATNQPSPMYFNLTDVSQLYELVIPTCSYRMGVPNMGYGAAIINKDGQMKFDVLWLPSRYLQLTLYLVILSFIGFWLFMSRLCRYVRILYYMLIDMN